MTKHRDVNDCRRQEKCKMAALIRLTSGYEMARDILKKGEKKRRKNAWWNRRGKERKTKQKLHSLKRKRRQEMSAMQVGSMNEESQVRGCYNITFVCTPTRKQCVLEKTQANKTFRT